jgi:hypothetical protein
MSDAACGGVSGLSSSIAAHATQARGRGRPHPARRARVARTSSQRPRARQRRSPHPATRGPGPMQSLLRQPHETTAAARGQQGQQQCRSAGASGLCPAHSRPTASRTGCTLTGRSQGPPDCCSISRRGAVPARDVADSGLTRTRAKDALYICSAYAHPPGETAPRRPGHGSDRQVGRERTLAMPRRRP